MSALAQAAAEYLTIRRTLGFKLHGHDRLLADFVEHLERSGSPLTAAVALAWATALPDVSPVRWAQRLSVVRGFARHLRCIDPSVEVPPDDLLSCRRHRLTPYLFSEHEVVQLVQAAGTLRPVLRGTTYATVLGLLAVSGMRIGEAIGLDRTDVDLTAGLVEIGDTKFRKHRRLPLHPTTARALRRYVEVRDAHCPEPRVPNFFVSTRGTRLLQTTLHAAFRGLVDDLGIHAPTGVQAPRVHGLRHGFAVATLRDWHREGADPAGKLALLSAYLGHADPAYTYWYLQACPELLGMAAERLERWEAGHR